MHLSNILFPLTILAGLVLASPIEQRSTGLTAVKSTVVPKFEAVSGQVRPTVAVHVKAGGATVANPNVSKRSDYNELEERATPFGTLIVCTGFGCSGRCFGYRLPVQRFTCFGTVTYNSVYASASDSLTYGVFVGTNCNGMLRCYARFPSILLICSQFPEGVLVPFVNTCYDIRPPGNTFFTN